MRLVLAGSPELVLSTFEVLIASFDVVAIISQPDARAGRDLKLRPTAVSELAAKHQIKLFKPQRIDDLYDELKALDYDLLITFAYGQLISERVLKLGRFAALNIHASLLPKYRGAAPIQAAVLNGDGEIGISLMQMVKKMDAGPVLFQAKALLSLAATSADAMQIVANLARENIKPWLALVSSQKVVAHEQSGEVSFAPKLSAHNAELSARDSCALTLRRILAFNPTPGAFTIINEQRVKIFNASQTKHKQALILTCADGELYVTDYQFASRKRIKLT